MAGNEFDCGMEPEIRYFTVFAVTDNDKGTVEFLERDVRAAE